ncbi:MULTISPECIES: 2Fe-2S iron-sulfur cluster-binding protein [unclassified Haladaptatus]|uniref:2Fe-2S iron-sulfur cluster-binding protein n=1 Tax=unclassified Haladaptatus TaxID=2622732 RepID=UPI00209C27A7|nr:MULTISPECIES: 2Fe-2S iron-sulfur cluster-binding protein [unclassified Haladaptatus]MCO8244868.1 2Fe-2S iron-sulfur cluster-binding protein [Haladaptatus sp. AB643]MCO8255619.1 2Fe-2S iron-sulfur cluster-binding protein [Haladaptatus sp. AB618]
MSSDSIWEDSHDGPDLPLNDYIQTGTANDPVVETSESARITINGETVTVEEGGTLLDAIKQTDAEENVPALCSYDGDDRIGPRSECRTCMVETENHGIVPSCSFPAEDGMVVRTDAEVAANARDVNLDLLLSDHNLRCTTCGKNGRCELQDVSIENNVVEPRYGVLDDRDEYEPLDESSPFIQIDRNKCILCNRCVEACNDVQVEGVLRIEGNGDDTRIGFQNGMETMMESTCVSCGHCATVCPTGALVEQKMTDVATIPIPGFTQENSIGKTIGDDYEHQSRQMTPMKEHRKQRKGGAEFDDD